MKSSYLHGFIPEEQQRLIDQAGLLTPLIYPRIDFSGCKQILEIGCGVGAQTAKLLELFPEAHLTCVDYSSSQLDKARENLSFAEGRVTFLQQDATQLELPQKYDGVYICWVLEHISEPVRVLESLKPYLAEGAKIWVTEVFNSTFFYTPRGKNLDHYYATYNAYQRSCGGNPDVGAELGNFFIHAGYTEVQLFPGGIHLDKKDGEFLQSFLDFWKKLMRSGSAGMLEAGLIKQGDIQAMEHDLDQIYLSDNPVFYYRFVQAFATA
ncbi:methyltransferase [Algoriphagus namhaensis]